MAFDSWGRYPKSTPAEVKYYEWRFENFPQFSHSVLPYGQGRSYGDSCLNNDQALLVTQHFNRLIEFNNQTGILRCESGVTLAEILEFSVPKGWFLPVSPGTKFVSVGGAIANDVHGKNHHRAGSFGCHVLSFELLRSDGTRVVCSQTENAALYNATIAGLGLTGLITWAEIQLKPINGPLIDMESIKFESLDEFFELSKESEKKFEYTVAWLDCVAKDENFGRGIFMQGNHSDRLDPGKKQLDFLCVPIDFPSFALNNLTVKAFNTLYYAKQREKVVVKPIHYNPFFYPLDSVHAWNKIYGKRGFLQFQCVVPNNDGEGQVTIKEILEEIVDSGGASFLAVLKEFGDVKSPGMLSFPRKGITLCLDFANRGAETLALFRRLYDVVHINAGAIYPAKDACLTKEEFRAAYPRWEEFVDHVDPKFSSSFWRRVHA